MDDVFASYIASVFFGWTVVSLLAALIVWGIDAQHNPARRLSHA